MDAKYVALYYIKLLLLTLVSWPLLASQDNIVLVAEKKQPSFK